MSNRTRPGYLTRYAAHANISRQAAAEQLERVGIDYMEPFDFADADNRREAARHADRVKFAKPIYPHTDGDEPTPEEPIAGTNPNDPNVQSFAEAQARERHFKAKLAEIVYLKETGVLVRKDVVEQAAFRLARQVRDAMQGIPDRIAGVLAAETDQRKIHDILSLEIRQALEALIGQTEERLT